MYKCPLAAINALFYTPNALFVTPRDALSFIELSICLDLNQRPFNHWWPLIVTPLTSMQSKLKSHSYFCIQLPRTCKATDPNKEVRLLNPIFIQASEQKSNGFPGMLPPPPPATRRDVTGSDGLPKSKVMAPPPPMSAPLQPLQQQQQPYPASSSPLMTSLPAKGLQKAKSKEEYDSRRSETGDEQVT